jgi:exopolysaccharide production protein ExoQ
MPSTLALLLWLILLLALLRFDPSSDSETPVALWVPLTWMFINGSRLPSQWLGIGVESQADAFEQGNPLDRAIYFFLILLAVGILMSRSFKWGEFFRRNFTLVLLIVFALVSVLWSDFPFVAFKRWFRDLGNYLMVLVVLTDPRPSEAAATVLRRLCYLLIPLSILLVKYYNYMAIHYSVWTGQPEYAGAATSKNMLGVVCLVSGIFFFWDTVTRWSDRKDRRTKRIILLNMAFIAMTLWLLNLADSATCRVCLAIGCLVILAAHIKSLNRHPAFLKVMFPACFVLYLILAYGFDINGELAKGVGRDPTLTGRSNIWHAVLSTNTNLLLGTGYQSFWLGPRLSHVWSLAGGVTEAHNGYLETYLNLGLVGCFLLFVFLIASYRAICKTLSPSFSLATLTLALWTIMLFYNMTESAAFSGHFLWVTFLLVLIVVSAQPPLVHGTLPVEKGSLTWRHRKPRGMNTVSPAAQSGTRQKTSLELMR